MVQARQGLDQSGRTGRVNACNQHVLAPPYQLTRDSLDLHGRLSLAEDHLRNALSNGAVMVHHRETEIRERELPKLGQGYVDWYIAHAHATQQV